MFSYAQYFKEAEINFSFAEHGTGLMVYLPARKISWQPGLEWYPERATLEDFYQFDYLLVNADSPIHSQFLRFDSIERVTIEDKWVLYKINK